MLAKLPPDIQQQVDRGISILKRGGLVAFPTDTVYGLGACANLSQAVERVYQVKERPRHMVLPPLIAHTLQLSTVAEPVPPKFSVSQVDTKAVSEPKIGANCPSWLLKPKPKPNRAIRERSTALELLSLQLKYAHQLGQLPREVV